MHWRGPTTRLLSFGPIRVRSVTVTARGVQSGATPRDAMVRAGQSSERAALIYRQSDLERQREVAAGLDRLVQARVMQRIPQHPARTWHGTLSAVQATGKARVYDLGLRRGAGDGNRTRALSLGSSCSTIKLHPRSGLVDQCRSVAHCTPSKAFGVLHRGSFVHFRRFGHRSTAGGRSSLPATITRSDEASAPSPVPSVPGPKWLRRGGVGAYLRRRSAAWSAVLLIP